MSREEEIKKAGGGGGKREVKEQKMKEEVGERLLWAQNSLHDQQGRIQSDGLCIASSYRQEDQIPISVAYCPAWYQAHM